MKEKEKRIQTIFDRFNTIGMSKTILKSARLLMITDWLEFCVAAYPMLTYTIMTIIVVLILANTLKWCVHTRSTFVRSILTRTAKIDFHKINSFKINLQN